MVKYSTGLTPSVKDKLVTLSTCALQRRPGVCCTRIPRRNNHIGLAGGAKMKKKIKWIVLSLLILFVAAGTIVIVKLRNMKKTKQAVLQSNIGYG